MPTYQYKCQQCEELLEVQQSFSDDALTVAQGCETATDGQHTLKKVFSAVGISFKGDGFYANDARSSGTSSSKPPATETKPIESTSKAPETKSESKPATSKPAPSE